MEAGMRLAPATVFGWLGMVERMFAVIIALALFTHTVSLGLDVVLTAGDRCAVLSDGPAVAHAEPANRRGSGG